ncbi:MAG: HNH endonuclease signature motif containing protein, partial [Candidatus Dormibacteria bacterium]
MEELKHLHHIIPRHAGGTDNPNNLFPLTLIQHALAHRNKAILECSPLDWFAWKMLSNLMGKEEVRRRAASIVMRKKVGKENSQWGSHWYNNGSKEQKIYGNQNTPIGWSPGRIKKPPVQEGVIPWNKDRTDYITDELRTSFGNAWRGKKNPKKSQRIK